MRSSVELRKVKGVYVLMSSERIRRKDLDVQDKYLWVSRLDNVVKWDSPRASRVKKVYWIYGKDGRDKRLLMAEYVREIHTNLF